MSKHHEENADNKTECVTFSSTHPKELSERVDRQPRHTDYLYTKQNRQAYRQSERMSNQRVKLPRQPEEPLTDGLCNRMDN